MDITPNRDTHDHSNTKIPCFKIKMSGVSLPKQTKQETFLNFWFFFVQKLRKPRDPAPRRFFPKKVFVENTPENRLFDPYFFAENL